MTPSTPRRARPARPLRHLPRRRVLTRLALWLCGVCAWVGVAASSWAQPLDPTPTRPTPDPGPAQPLTEGDGWEVSALYEGRAPLGWAMATQAVSGRAVAYAFTESDAAKVGIWPDLAPVSLGERARVGCLRLTADGLWVGVIARDAGQPTASLRVESLGRDGTRRGTWRLPAPAFWPDIGARCALLLTDDAPWPYVLARGRSVQDGAGGPPDLWWLSPDGGRKPLGLGPSLPQLLGDQADAHGVLVHLQVVAAPAADSARAWEPAWFRLQPDGVLASAPAPTVHLTPWPGLARLSPADQLLHQRPDAALVLRAETHRVEVVTLSR